MAPTQIVNDCIWIMEYQEKRFWTLGTVYIICIISSFLLDLFLVDLSQTFGLSLVCTFFDSTFLKSTWSALDLLVGGATVGTVFVLTLLDRTWRKSCCLPSFSTCFPSFVFTDFPRTFLKSCCSALCGSFIPRSLFPAGDFFARTSRKSFCSASCFACGKGALTNFLVSPLGLKMGGKRWISLQLIWNYYDIFPISLD